MMVMKTKALAGLAAINKAKEAKASEEKKTDTKSDTKTDTTHKCEKGKELNFNGAYSADLYCVKTGKEFGTAILRPAHDAHTDGTNVTFLNAIFPEGTRGFQICEDQFGKVHYDVGGHNHGKSDPWSNNHHKGDLGNLKCDGKRTPLNTLTSNYNFSAADVVGKYIVVRDHADDCEKDAGGDVQFWGKINYTSPEQAKAHYLEQAEKAKAIKKTKDVKDKDVKQK